MFGSYGEPAALKYGAHEHERPERDRGRGNQPQPTPTQGQEDHDGAGGQCDREDEAAEMKSESVFVVAVQIRCSMINFNTGFHRRCVRAGHSGRS